MLMVCFLVGKFCEVMDLENSGGFRVVALCPDCGHELVDDACCCWVEHRWDCVFCGAVWHRERVTLMEVNLDTGEADFALYAPPMPK
jgi:hypothetical protein